MAEEIIITKFIGDTSQMDAQIQKLTKDMAGYDDATVKATADTAKFETNLGSASVKMGQLGASSKGAAEAAANVGKVGTEATKSATGIGGLVGKIQTGFGNATNSVKGFASKATASVGGFFSNVKAGLPSLSGIGGAFQSATGAVGGFAGTALSALGPVGIAVGALAGGLLKIVSNTDAGQVALDGFGRTGGIVFDKITGQVTGFFDRLFTGSTAFDTFAQKAGEAADFIITKLTPVGFLLDQIGAIDAFKEAAKDGQQLAQIYDNIEEAQTSNIEANAKLERQVGQLNIQLRDRTKTDEERLAIGAKIDQLEGQRIDNELKVLKTISSAKRAEAALELRDKGEVSDATKRALADAVAAEERAAQSSEQITERTANRVNAIEDASLARREANNAKRIAAEQKAAAEELALAQKTAAAKQASDKIAQDASDAALDAGLTEQDRAIVAIDRRYAAEVKAAEEAFAKLQELAGTDLEAQSAIATQKKQALVDINTAKNAELNALEREQTEAAQAERQADIDLVREATATKADLERDAINKRFDAAKEAAERTITDEEAQTAKLLEVQIARDEALAAVQDEAQIAETEKLKQQQEARVAVLNDVSNELGALTEAAASGQIETAEEAGKALVGIALKTIGNIISAQLVEIIAGSVSGGVRTGGAIGGFAGLAAGTALAAIVKGLFAAAAAQIQGNYTGDPYVGGDGSRPQLQGRDGYLRRLDKGERVVTTKTNGKHYDLFEAAENGTLEKYIETHHTKEKRTVSEIMERKRIERYLTNVLRVENIRTEMDRSTVDAGLFKATRTGDLSTFIANNYTTCVNTYMESEQGQRATSVVFPRYFDKGIVEASNAARKEQKTTNRLLSELVEASSRKAPRQHPRY